MLACSPETSPCIHVLVPTQPTASPLVFLAGSIFVWLLSYRPYLTCLPCLLAISPIGGQSLHLSCSQLNPST